MLYDVDIDSEFSFQPLNFSSRFGGGEGQLVSGVGDADDIVIKTDPECFEMEETDNVNDEVGNDAGRKKHKNVKKNETKVKSERVKRTYSEEDENTVNSLLQIDELGAYACMSPGCDKKWKSKSGMKAHIRRTHLNLVQYKCEQCEYVSKYLQALKAHVLAIHEQIFQKCEFCDYTAKYKTNILSHVKFVHTKVEKLQCHLCEYQAPKQYLLDYHIKGMHEKATLHCDQCSFSTNWKNSLLKHYTYKHKMVEKTNQCDSCGFSAPFLFEVKRHIYLQHGGGKTLCFEKNSDGVYECDQCEYSSDNLRQIKTHFYSSHVA